MHHSDTDIVGAPGGGILNIEPLNLKTQLQPATYDMLLGEELLLFTGSRIGIDPRAPLTENVHYRRFKLVSYMLRPGDFILGTTVERVELSPALSGQVMGKSSLGRIGLQIHATAGFIDPGFKGRITLEISNINKVPIWLYANMPICQLAIFELKRPAQRPYGHPDLNSKYQEQATVEPSQYHRNVTNGET